MGSGNVEVIRDHYAATNERDFERAMSHYDDDVVLEVHGEGFYAGTHAGKERTGRFFGDWLSSFGPDARFEIVELTELDDGSVALVANHHARGRASGVEVHGVVAWLYRLRDGKIVRVEGDPTSYDEVTHVEALAFLRGLARERDDTD
jgi:ketosteroid isomerase-like protein